MAKGNSVRTSCFWDTNRPYNVGLDPKTKVATKDAQARLRHSRSTPTWMRNRTRVGCAWIENGIVEVLDRKTNTFKVLA